MSFKRNVAAWAAFTSVPVLHLNRLTPPGTEPTNPTKSRPEVAAPKSRIGGAFTSILRRIFS